MEIGALYAFVLTIVLVGMVLAVGLVILGNLATASGVTAKASTSINSTITALQPIATTWMGLIVTIAVLAIVLNLVIRSFQNTGGR